MSERLTPETAAALAAELRAKGEAMVKEGEALIAESEVIEGYAQGLRRLQEGAPSRTVRSMDIDTRGRSAAVKRGAARATRKHPAQQRLYDAGVTITDVARELRETRARVSSWMAEGTANRPIPRRHAEYLKERYHVPIGCWARIAG